MASEGQELFEPFRKGAQCSTPSSKETMAQQVNGHPEQMAELELKSCVLGSVVLSLWGTLIHVPSRGTLLHILHLHVSLGWLNHGACSSPWAFLSLFGLLHCLAEPTATEVKGSGTSLPGRAVTGAVARNQSENLALEKAPQHTVMSRFQKQGRVSGALHQGREELSEAPPPANSRWRN